ncbi:VpsF family polysaccharide biosynthesis protein [Pleomorphomonas sp. NRK KF1]|uniref:VpsF family polysaccharide biosynthesis protein n=1 Tax=Pleomorphomonas sp. NRK KF1 TaxID=2943000 RepID=UPI0020448D3F|nr:VpsF family polysaccharide biosynthesis protein [Pleomorphomonas sp. NRK KF1]MCM5553643.1 VpsF family polysaccharide biosynthesis protein [Pleomorphomonas sp. NRK KF1]
MALRAFLLPVSYRTGSVGFAIDVRPFAAGLTVLSVLALFLLSGPMLNLIGIPYDAAGGSPLLKIHPASYLSVLALATWIVVDGGLGPFLGRSWRDSPGLVALFLAIGLLAFQVIGVQKTPISQVTDNFVMTACLFASLARLDSREMRFVALLVQAILAVNSTLGYVEGLSGFRLTPLYVNGELLTWEWRATALLGHPLMNAMITTVCLVSLALGAGPFRQGPRLFLVLFHFGALFFFGGRTAIVLSAASLFAIAAFSGARLLLGRRFPLPVAAAAIFAATFLVIGAVLVVDGGMVDRLIGRFINDDGSAMARVAMLSVFRDMSWPEVVFGPDVASVKAMLPRIGTPIAIESAYVGFVAYYGGFVTLFFLMGLAAFFAELIRRFGAAVLMPLGIYFLISTAVSSFSTKSIELGLLTTLIITAFASRLRTSERSPPC